MKNLCHYTGKIYFKSIEEARNTLFILKQFTKRRGIDGRRIKKHCHRIKQKRIYNCIFCEGYHLISWKWWSYGSEKYLSGLNQKMRPLLLYRTDGRAARFCYEQNASHTGLSGFLAGKGML